jgi:hypothetical protein
LKNPLTEIASKEEPICTICGQRGEEPQFGDPDILCLIHNHKIERAFGGCHVRRDTAEQTRPSHSLALGETSPHALDNRP